jgi:hypothetical protein
MFWISAAHVLRKLPRLIIGRPRRCFIWEVQIRKEAEVVIPLITGSDNCTKALAQRQRGCPRKHTPDPDLSWGTAQGAVPIKPTYYQVDDEAKPK